MDGPLLMSSAALGLRDRHPYDRITQPTVLLALGRRWTRAVANGQFSGRTRIKNQAQTRGKITLPVGQAHKCPVVYWIGRVNAMAASL